MSIRNPERRRAAGLTSPQYTPGANLDSSTLYNWQIVSKGGQLGDINGPTWSFTTTAGSALRGDITDDGILDVRDLLLMQRVLTGVVQYSSLTQSQQNNADLAPGTGDGKVDAADLLALSALLP